MVFLFRFVFSLTSSKIIYYLNNIARLLMVLLFFAALTDTYVKNGDDKIQLKKTDMYHSVCLDYLKK